MRRFLTILLLTCFIHGLYAQELSVKSFRESTNDLTARTKVRFDRNEEACALIKVQLAAAGAVFSGNVMGDIEYSTSEYLVYMTQGSKRLTVRLEGYLPLEVIFEDFGIKSLIGKTVYVLTLSGVTGAQHLEAPKTKTGWIVLDSEPSGASVYINDEFVGTTPLSNYKQAYGTYQFKLESPNYHPATGTIELIAGRFEQRFVLKPAFGSISVKSSIAGAKILLDGKQTGKQTPTTLTEIPSGTHTISLQMDKYAPKQQEVIVEDGQIADVSMTLDARFARITINSLDGAEIYSNGKLLGKGRISDDMMEGYYDLEARLDHHKTVTNQIQVVAGQSQEITLNPVPKYGSLDIVSTPHNATITIDGEEVGKTPFTIEKLLEGEHTVAISKEGYSVFKIVIDIAENKTETVSVTMEKRVPVANKTTLPQGNAQININERDASITVYGRLTVNDWSRIRYLCKTKKIKIVDLRNAECEIGYEAFSGCSSLTSITIPNSVTCIGASAFANCTNLTSITLPNSVTRIEDSAFENCTSLTSITIPNSVSTIGEFAFFGCIQLTSITIPNSVTSIGFNAFRECIRLTSITIPNSVTSIGEYAFFHCYQLTVYVPKGFDKNKIQARKIVEMK